MTTQPQRDVNAAKPSYTGSYFRQRIKNIVGAYVDGRESLRSRTVLEPPTTARLVEERLGEEETLNKIEAKDVATVIGDEKLVLFPTYARAKPHLFHATHKHIATSEHGNVFQWQMLIVVDVDLAVHGQVSIPHVANAPLRRKDRILLSVARQICGLPPMPTNSTPGMVKKRSIDIIRKMSGRSGTTTPLASSPTFERKDPFAEGFLAQAFSEEPDMIDMNSPEDALSVRSDLSRTPSRTDPPNGSLKLSPSYASFSERFSPPSRASTVPNSRRNSASSEGGSISPTRTNTASVWKNSHNFPLLDLAQCHANLTERLAPFIARSVAGRLVTIKVYAPPTSSSDLEARDIIAERQFLTNDYGHFMGRLIVSPPQNGTTPDTWTITASLSPTPGSKPQTVSQEVKFIPEHGISLISDIDDTVKHTSILSGARELFRNTFVRELHTMSIEGVREWYTSLTNLGVQIHYVSNSPYQCWPIINKFMDAVGLPRGGSVHLKQYSGMISGIWENAADKKRAGVETIVRDFPGRKFILVGDSGEQDLELYTEIALNYRHQVLGIFIRDVTTPLLSRTSTHSSSQNSLPRFFEGNGQPSRKESRLSQLKSFTGGSWRKSSDLLPTLATLPQGQVTAFDDEDTQSNDSASFEQMAIRDVDLLSPFVFKAEEAGEGILTDLPLRRSKTPPPVLPSRPGLSRSSSALSMSSEPADTGTITMPQPVRVDTSGTEDQSSRMKRVENWRKRLARCRERLMAAEGNVEIWTWRVGSDVERICESLISRNIGDLEGGLKKGHVNGHVNGHAPRQTSNLRA
jgi:phosphatidate phosphatase APP1